MKENKIIPITPITPGGFDVTKRERERLNKSRELIDQTHPCGKFSLMLEEKILEDREKKRGGAE